MSQTVNQISCPVLSVVLNLGDFILFFANLKLMDPHLNLWELSDSELLLNPQAPVVFGMGPRQTNGS